MPVKPRQVEGVLLESHLLTLEHVVIADTTSNVYTAKLPEEEQNEKLPKKQPLQMRLFPNLPPSLLK